MVAPQDTYDGGSWRPSNLAQAALMPVGETLHRLMQLNGVPRADLDAVLAELQGR